MVKFVNNNNNGPFGGCVPAQMVVAGAAPADANAGAIPAEVDAPAARRRRSVQM